jgi:GR25 family glycosyltransferase involved in LPS biosynthesis
MISVFVNHYKILTERKKYLQSVLKNCKWIEDPSKEDLTEGIKKEWYSPSEDFWKKKTERFYNPNFRNLSDGDIACSLGHIIGWHEFIKENNPYGVFLEDDVVINVENFEEKIESILNESPNDLDVLFIGGGFPHNSVTRTEKIINENFHLKKHPSTNCACSYILTKKSAQKLVENIKPFVTPIDFELNYWFSELNFNVYHYIPYFVSEGSKTGQYQSAQQ